MNPVGIAEAETILAGLASVFFQSSSNEPGSARSRERPGPNLEARYRALLDQIPAVVFMAYLDQGIGEAYVSPQIEASLGFSQREWLEDPVRWYQQIHPDDKDRWSDEAAEMFLSGKPLRSAYRILALHGRVVWFQCEARLMRRDDGEALVHSRGRVHVVSAIFDTVGALVIVLDREGRIVRFQSGRRADDGLFGGTIPGQPHMGFVHCA